MTMLRAARQRFRADGFPGDAPHNHRGVQGHAFEAPQVFGVAPGQGAADADDTVFADRNDRATRGGGGTRVVRHPPPSRCFIHGAEL